MTPKASRQGTVPKHFFEPFPPLSGFVPPGHQHLLGGGENSSTVEATTAVAGRTAECKSCRKSRDITPTKGESAGDTTFRPREWMVLEEQEDRLAVVVEPLLEVLDARFSSPLAHLNPLCQH